MFDSAAIGAEIGSGVGVGTRTSDTAQSATPGCIPVPTPVPSHETPSEWAAPEENLLAIVRDKTKVLQVYCDRPDHLNPSLMAPTQRIVLVSSPAQADVLYLIDHTISVPGV